MNTQSVTKIAMVSHWLSFVGEGRVLLHTGKVELGQGIYVALIRIVAEELDISPYRVDVTGADTAVTQDEGITAGSVSVSTSGHLIGQAASAARSLFIDAAQPQAAGREISIADGEILFDGRRSGESYWSLARHVDLNRPVSEHARLKNPDSYQILGRPGIGRHLLDTVTGAAFIHDLEWPGLLHARMIRPSHISASVVDFPGEIPADVTLIRDGCFIGVIASREERAVLVAQQLARRIRWSTPSSLTEDPLGAIDAASSSGVKAERRPDGSGVVDLSLCRPFLSHGSIGLCCAIALWEAGRLRVWSHSQGVFQLRTSLAKLLAISPEAIRVTHVSGAGCYGHNGADDVAADAALLARSTPGRPIRVMWTRAQELGGGPFGPAMRSHIEAEMSANGRVTRMRTEIASYPHSRRPTVGGGVNLLAAYLREDKVTTDPILEPPAAVGGGAERNGKPYYDILETELEYRIVREPTVRTSALRTLGAHLNVSAIESVMDEATALAGADPVAFRLEHLTDRRARAVINRVAALSAWRASGLNGIAFARYKNAASYCAVVAEVVLDHEVQVTRVWCAVDAGRVVDPDGLKNQIEGGIIQAISWTLKEAVPFADGCALIGGWNDYPILRFDQIPEITVDIIDHPHEPSLGIGEASTGPASGAICNAISKTLGARVCNFPITRERIVAAIC